MAVNAIKKFQQRTGRAPARTRPVSMPIDTSITEFDEAGLDYYWHPEREGVEQAPKAFQDELAVISTDVKVVRPPARAPLYFPRAWLVWYRKPSVKIHLSPGWLMLIDWRNQHGAPMQLDARVFSYLYSISARKFGNGEKYWAHCVAEKKREDAAKEKTYTNERRDRQNDYRNFTKIKNIGSGSKFARHGDGTIVPGKNALAMHLAERKRQIPSEVARDEAEQRERARAARG
jgi:hypothetical protein